VSVKERTGMREEAGCNYFSTVFSSAEHNTTARRKHRARHSLFLLVVSLFKFCGTMDVQLTDRLLNLNYKDEPDVTRNSLHECLFQCFVHCVKTWESRPKHVENIGESVLLHYPTHATRPLNEREKVDVSTPTGMRLLAADKAESMLDPSTPHPSTASLQKHIKHRFRSAYMRERDSEVLGEAALPDDAPDDDKFDAWCKLMRTTGNVFPSAYLLALQ
jgi:hypothetical protein